VSYSVLHHIYIYIARTYLVAAVVVERCAVFGGSAPEQFSQVEPCELLVDERSAQCVSQLRLVFGGCAS
jgi:hypothetical protein